MRKLLQLLRGGAKPDRKRVEQPDLTVYGVTGDAQTAVPQMARWGERYNRRVCLAHRYDDVRWEDYDRVRLYPVVRDAVLMMRIPAKRAAFHFACANGVAAELAMQTLGPKIPFLIDQLVKGGLEFGWQAVEKVWKPEFGVKVTSTQSDSGASVESEFPFVWTIDRFKVFDPQHARIYVKERDGRFAGIKQLVARYGADDVPGEKCIHFVYDWDFDGNYGLARTKPAVPFVELAESIYDDLARYTKKLAVPWAVGKHKPGFTSGPDGTQISNADIMADFLSGLESGSSGSLPAEYDRASGNPLWEVVITAVTGETKFTEQLDHVNQVIRMALAMPQMASSQTPDSGTYNLGVAQIDLFLENIEATLTDVENVINEQLMKEWTLYNFGSGHPPVRLVMAPVSVKVKIAMLKALVNMLNTGMPVEDGQGGELQADWAKVAEDAGVPLKKIDARQRARDIVAAATARAQSLSQPAEEPTEGLDEEDDL